MGNLKMDLFFELKRHKTHIFCDVKENALVLELKKVIEGILKIPAHNLVLKKRLDDGNWLTLEDRQPLSDCGYNPQNSRAQAPAELGFLVVNEEDEVHIEPLSQPPPVPDAMRPDQTANSEQ